MASSILRRVWNKLRSPRSYVGKDLEGNKYFEYPNPNDNFGRTKRVVKYRHGYDMWTYIAGKRRLPVQWTAWLTHTRVHAPTIEELHADLMRQERLRLRVAMIEAAERDATPTISVNIDSTHLPNMPVSTLAATATGPDEKARGQPSLSTSSDTQKARPDLSFAPAEAPSSDAIEAWAPKIARRDAN